MLVSVTYQCFARRINVNMANFEGKGPEGFRHVAVGHRERERESRKREEGYGDYRVFCQGWLIGGWMDSSLPRERSIHTLFPWVEAMGINHVPANKCYIKNS